jgi:CHAD domain-containing protein
VVLRLAQDLLASVRCCEAGVLRGLDPECLHQYRVRLRRLRALLSRLGRVVPREALTELGDGLRELARRTGRLRDLDVLLLAEPAYRHLVPEPLHPRLQVAFLRARRQRGLERGRFVRLLRSRVYSLRMERWREVMAEVAAMPTEGKAGRPIGELLRNRIRKTYRSMVREVAKLPMPVPDLAYHRLRIRCKRLRYLLDLFRDLLDKRSATALGKRLQALQEVLGAMNDLAVQRGHLTEFLGTDPEGVAAVVATPTATAVRALWRRLDRRRSTLACQARRLLRTLCGRGTVRLVERL